MDFNEQIIEEFRTNNGKVGGDFEGAPMLLLHHRGAKTGTARVNPLVYQVLEGGKLAVFASKGGAPTNPDWFHNLKANPETQIEVGTDNGVEKVEVRARVAEFEERDRVFEAQKQVMPVFSDYEQNSGRQIPVVVLEKR